MPEAARRGSIAPTLRKCAQSKTKTTHPRSNHPVHSHPALPLFHTHEHDCLLAARRCGASQRGACGGRGRGRGHGGRGEMAATERTVAVRTLSRRSVDVRVQVQEAGQGACAVGQHGDAAGMRVGSCACGAGAEVLSGVSAALGLREDEFVLVQGGRAVTRESEWVCVEAPLHVVTRPAGATEAHTQFTLTVRTPGARDVAVSVRACDPLLEVVQQLTSQQQCIVFRGKSLSTFGNVLVGDVPDLRNGSVLTRYTRRALPSTMFTAALVRFPGNVSLRLDKVPLCESVGAAIRGRLEARFSFPAQAPCAFVLQSPDRERVLCESKSLSEHGIRTPSDVLHIDVVPLALFARGKRRLGGRELRVSVHRAVQGGSGRVHARAQGCQESREFGGDGDGDGDGNHYACEVDLDSDGDGSEDDDEDDDDEEEEEGEGAEEDDDDRDADLGQAGDEDKDDVENDDKEAEEETEDMDQAHTECHGSQSKAHKETRAADPDHAGAVLEVDQPAKLPKKQQGPPRARCHVLCCQRRVPLLTVPCRCGKTLCARHACDHACSFDWRANGREQLTKTLDFTATPKLPFI